MLDTVIEYEAFTGMQPLPDALFKDPPRANPNPNPDPDPNPNPNPTPNPITLVYP
mgnify:CR=1 FL=1